MTGLEVREKASRVLFLFPKPLTQDEAHFKKKKNNTRTQTRARHHTQTDKLFVYNFDWNEIHMEQPQKGFCLYTVIKLPRKETAMSIVVEELLSQNIPALPEK